MTDSQTRIGYTTGVFDMFHIGHLNILRRARMQCDQLVVGVTTDDLCFARKKTYPIIPFTERIQIVENIKYVDRAISQDSMDKMRAWQSIRFDKIFVGSDWQGTKQWSRIEAEFTGLGVKVVYLPYTEHTSSSKLRAVIKNLYDSAVLS